MNVMDGKNQPKKRASFGEELNINDYSQDDTLSNQNSQGSDDLPLEEIEQILCEQGHVLSQKETILIAKINHLQNKCNRLTVSNYELARRVEDLEEDSLALSEVEINESMANQFLEVMEREIADYKQQFQQYRNRQINVLHTKEEEIQKLRATIQDLKLANDCLQESRDNALDENDEMSKLNQELVIEIERLEDEFAQINSHNSSLFTSYPVDNRSYFEGQVQEKLQALIQKLMQQLKAERVHKKRMNEQIKIMQQQILDLQRQLSVKNQQIIEIEMSYLKSNRLAPITHNKNEELAMQRTRTLTGPNSQVHGMAQNGIKAVPNSVVFKPFSLGSFLNNEEQINSKERLVIAGKIIDFYLKKVTNVDFSTLELENIVICNFSHRNPRLCLIRKGQANINDQYEGTQQLLIQNLCQALNALFNQKRSPNQTRTKCEKEALSIIARILKNKNHSLLDVHQMKQIIINGLKGLA